MSRENFPSFIPAEKALPELTIKAVLVGTFLAIILGAANAYLGLYAGMTVSAIIPGAVMALALMKPFKPSILEVNIATMGASAGECIAAGVIFTIPALILLGAWNEIHYLETTFIAIIGGMLGVFWMIPLRRALVVKTDLPFPEGIAVAAVLTTTVGGEQTQKKDHVSGTWLAFGALTATLFKFGQLALNLFRDTIDGIFSIGKYAIFGEEHDAWFYAGTTTSPALLAVGWIIGPRISSYVLVGGLIGWVIIAPLLILVTGLPAATAEYSGLGPLIGGFYKVWSEQVRYIGVGAMLMGGLWAVYSIRTNLIDGVKEAIIGFKKQGTITQKRTEQDLNYKLVFIAITATTIPIFVLYQILSGLIGVSLVMAILTIFLAFIASALAGYLTGLVGSSNCPISGVTVTILLIVSLLMLCLGVMQISMIFGVIAISTTVGIVIGVLHQAFTIGSIKLPAPQAFLMKGIVQGILDGNMLWPYVVAGAVLALVLILINLPVLPVAIGIYLPFTLSVPIFLGGGIRAMTNVVLEKKYGNAEQAEHSDWELAIKQTDVTPKEKAIRTGLLFTAGLVAGEALMGVIIAVLIVLGIHLALFDTAPWWPGLLVFAFISILLMYIPIREILSDRKTNK
ncbi:peptide transporter [Thermoplasmatales archaeon SM1-50]|nr:MAG: peptide transporter [Thermoplasmatales archaeon SM1-50]